MQHYMVIIENGKNNFSAYSPDVPGCAATGKTVEQTVSNMKDALCFHLEDLLEHGEPFPVSKNLEEYITEIDINAGDLFTFVNVELDMAVSV
ncbi:antitoxin HicB [Candidatus Magnetomoraceae bacterium gMMP-15]